MKTDVKKDIAVSIFFAVLASLYLFGTRTISVFSPFGKQGLDSKSIPIMIGSLMLALSILFLITTLLRHFKNVKNSTIKSEEASNGSVCDPAHIACVIPPQDGVAPSPLKKAFPVKLILSLVLLCLYIAFYQSVGFIITSAAYLILESLLLTPTDKRKKWTLFIIVSSIVFTVLIYIIFSKYLSLFLPSGILG